MPSASLTRQLGLWSASALVVSNMIGTGIFGSTGFMAGDLGSVGLVLGVWLAGGFIALLGALCYSELSTNFPRSGGEYVYLTEAYGTVWGFIVGWISFFAGFSAPIAATTLIVSSYLSYFTSALDPEGAEALRVAIGPLSLNLGGGALLACAIVVAFTGLNILGVSIAAKAQNTLTLLKLIVLASLVGFGFAIGNGDWSHFSQEATRISTHSLFTQFALSLVFGYYAYSGWNAAVYVAEEIRDPDRTLPRAMIIGTLFVTAFFIALNCLFIYANPLEEMKGVVAVGAQAADSLFGPRGGGIFAAMMALSLLATINAMCIVGPRVYYAMAKDRAFFAAAARIHPKWGTPWVAVIAQGACCIALILTGTFESLAYYIGFTLSLGTAMAVFALFLFRRRPGWKKQPWVSFAWPAIPAVYVIVNIYVFGYFCINRQEEALWSFLTIAGGAIAYKLSRRGAKA